MVEPRDGIITIYILDNSGKFITHKPYTVTETIHSKTLPAISIDLKTIFPELLKEPEIEYEGNYVRV